MSTWTGQLARVGDRGAVGVGDHVVLGDAEVIQDGADRRRGGRQVARLNHRLQLDERLVVEIRDRHDSGEHVAQGCSAFVDVEVQADGRIALLHSTASAKPVFLNADGAAELRIQLGAAPTIALREARTTSRPGVAT